MANHETVNYFHQEKKERFVTQRMVVKIGGSTIVEGGRVDVDFVNDMARQAGILFHAGVKIAIVCSGAVDTGNLLVRNIYDVDIDRQTAAFFGQSELIKEWIKAFERKKVLAGELMVSENDLFRINKTLLSVMNFGIPIINGYDALDYSDKEVRKRMISADNDRLAAFVSKVTAADTSVFLTDVDGVLDENDSVIPFVDRLEDIEDVITEEGEGTGGMKSKCMAAHLVARTFHNKRSIIAKGKTSDVLLRIARGENLGTRFGKGWMLY